MDVLTLAERETIQKVILIFDRIDGFGDVSEMIDDIEPVGFIKLSNELSNMIGRLHKEGLLTTPYIYSGTIPPTNT